MSFPQLNTENKLHVNLSRHANAIIESDMAAFQISTKSTFINQIITNFKDTAETTISSSSERYRQRHAEALAGYMGENGSLQKSGSAENFIDALIDNYIKMTSQQHYDKGSGFKIRLNNDNVDYFTNESTEDIYYPSVSSYVKSLIEEYCRKPYLEREAIYAKNLFETIDTAIREQKVLSLRIKTNSRARGQDIVKIKPYRVETDVLSMYHYVIGYEIFSSDQEKGHTLKNFSCRVTNLEKARILQQHAFISKEDKKKLDMEIEEKGVQFVNEELMDCRIYLSDKGIQLYNRILHLRPPYKKIDKDGHTYTFRCSRRQLEYYFFKFGADAIILSPEALKSHFAHSYENAVKAYSQPLPTSK